MPGRPVRRSRPVLAGCVGLLATFALARTIGRTAEPEGPTPKGAKAEFRVETLAGQVVWLAEAQRAERGIQSVPEAAERVLALRTADGHLIPLVEDVRGRAFRRDARLRGIPLELAVRRYEHTPFVQVIGVYAVENGQRVELDYWCQICAIAMYELKDCECCQGPIELRRRPVKP